MCHLRNGLEVRYVVPRVPDALDVDGLGPVVDELGKLLGIVSGHEFGGDAEPRHQHLELVVGAAVQIRGRHDIVPGVRQCRDDHELGRLARRRGHGGDTALERGHSLFEYIDRRLWQRGPSDFYVHVTVSGCSFIVVA